MIISQFEAHATFEVRNIFVGYLFYTFNYIMVLILQFKNRNVVIMIKAICSYNNKITLNFNVSFYLTVLEKINILNSILFDNF